MRTIPMEPLRRPLALLGATLPLLGCQPKIPGTYELDFEETKRAVLRAVEANPAERQNQDDTLKMLEATRLTIKLHEGGKLETTTELTNRQALTPPPRAGTWKLEGGQVVMSVTDENLDAHAHAREPDARCTVDGRRLRCFKPFPHKLFENYVLIRK